MKVAVALCSRLRLASVRWATLVPCTNGEIEGDIQCSMTHIRRFTRWARYALVVEDAQDEAHSSRRSDRDSSWMQLQNRSWLTILSGARTESVRAVAVLFAGLSVVLLIDSSACSYRYADTSVRTTAGGKAICAESALSPGLG